MLLNIENEIISLVTAVSAFNSPILTALSPALITDDVVLSQMAYNQAPQKVNPPYLYWLGPHNYFKGQLADPTKKTIRRADFWFYCCHNTLTEAMIWAGAIEEAMDAVSFPITLVNCRITAAILIDKIPIEDDQTIKTANEFPVSRAAIGYRFGYHSSNH